MTAEERKRRNAELLERLHRDGETPELMAEFWEVNFPVISWTVRKVTGLSPREDGFEDMTQQAYFGFAAAVREYSDATGAAFETYAVNRVKWSLCRYYDSNGYSLKVPQYMVERIRACYKTRRKMTEETGRRVTNEDALKAMGLSPLTVNSTLSAIRRVEDMISLDAKNDAEDGDGKSLLDRIAAGEGFEEAIIAQEWQRELHGVIMKAVRELKEDEREIIIRHYFQGVTLSGIADSMKVTRQAISEKKKFALYALRVGKFASELAEFMPDTARKERADRIIKQDRAALSRLQLSTEEKEMLAL